MRLPALCIFLALASISFGQKFHTMAFVTQNFHSAEWKSMERFGKGEKEIVSMGHESFIKWYCDDARASKEGRIQAEKVYGTALNECSAPLLLSLPRKEQVFMEGAICAFADMAKSSVVAGISGSGDGPAWSLRFAEVGTAVANAVYTILNPSRPVVEETAVDLDSIYKTVTNRVKANYPNNVSDGERIRFLVGYINDHFKDRSKREKLVAKSFGIKMAKITVLSGDSE